MLMLYKIKLLGLLPISLKIANHRAYPSWSHTTRHLPLELSVRVNNNTDAQCCSLVLMYALSHCTSQNAENAAKQRHSRLCGSVLAKLVPVSINRTISSTKSLWKQVTDSSARKVHYVFSTKRITFVTHTYTHICFPNFVPLHIVTYYALSLTGAMYTSFH